MKAPLKNYVAPDLADAKVDRLYRGAMTRVGRRRLRTRLATAALAAALLVLVGWRAMRHETPIASSAPPDRALTLHDGSRAFFESSTELKVEEDGAHATRLSLASGKARFDVTHDPSRVFAVEAGEVTIVDVGTVFEVVRDERHVRVSVERGSVRVESRSGVVATLQGGQAWESNGQAPAPVASSVPVVDIRDLPPAPKASSSASETPHDRFARAVAAAGPKELFDLADSANLDGRPQDAAFAYDALRRRYRDDSRAGIAAFQLGRLRQDKLGDPGGAEEALRDAMTLVTDPSMREDAESRRVAALETLGDVEGCKKARDEYLKREPSGLHAKAVAGRCGN